MDFVYDRNKTAVIYKEKEYSYKELIKISKIYSSFLEIGKGDRAAIFFENRPEYGAAVLSVWDKKATCTNLDSSYNAEQVAYVFIDSYPKCILVSNQTVETAQEAVKISGKDVKIINVDEIDKEIDIKIERFAIEALEKDDIAVMLYTSGTTGNPKGVMLTYDNLLSNIEAVRDIELVNDTDRVLALLPYHHVLPLVLTLLMPLYFGCLVVILDELSSDSIKKHLQKYKITVVIGVPRVWEMFHKGIMNKIKSSPLSFKLFKLCKKLKNPALSRIIFKKVQEAFGGHIRILVSGGAKLDPEIGDDFNTFGLNMLEGYGLTETSPIICFNRPEDIRMGTVGTVIPNVRVKLEEDGEIVVKGRNVMKGYFNKPEATAEAIDKDGWFHTGDLGEFDGDHLKIIGRKKEMIVLSNGKNINPSDIEAEILKETDLIQEVAVAEYDNHLVAIIYPDFKVLEAKKIFNAKEAIKWEVVDKYNITAPKYRKILDIIIVKQELPKTKLGKLRRFMLKDLIVGLEKAGEGNVQAEPEKKESKNLKEMESEEFKAVSKFIRSLHDEIEIIPESHMEIDLGLDSLDIVEIITFIENTFAVEIREEDFARIKTIEALCQYIREKGGRFEEQEVNRNKIFNEPVSQKLPKSSFYAVLFTAILRPIFSSYIRIKKVSQEKMEKTPPVIYVGNHQSMLDAFILTQAMPAKVLRDTYFLAIAIHFEGKIKKYLAENGNVIIIDSNKNLKDTLKVAAKVLKEGKNIVIFPEGARTRDGEIQEFKKSFAILSKELNVPVVPFALKGAFELMPYGTRVPKGGEVKIEILDQIEPGNLTVDEIVEKTKQAIVEKL